MPVLRRRCSKTRSHDPSCTPCTPHSGSTSRLQSHMRQWHRWHARSRYIHRRRARMGCGPGTCLRMQVCNARRRMPGECSRREEPLIRQRQLHGSGACIVHSDGQRPAHRHTNACTSAANRHGCGGRARPQAVSVRIPKATVGLAWQSFFPDIRGKNILGWR